MRVTQLGRGDPEVSVVACLHGDETCGKAAIDWFAEHHPPIERPVQLILANERAVDAGTRSIDEDGNRVFIDELVTRVEEGTDPVDLAGESHEKGVAARLYRQTKATHVLDLHSTVSYELPFALVQNVGPAEAWLARTTAVENVVDIGYVDGGYIDHVEGVAVECGLKGSPGAEANAALVVWNFLAANGAIDAPHVVGTPDLYAIYGIDDHAGYEFLGRNFELIEAGEAYARKGNEDLRATESFYPILMSTDGYDDMLGFKATYEGRIAVDPPHGFA